MTRALPSPPSRARQLRAQTEFFAATDLLAEALLADGQQAAHARNFLQQALEEALSCVLARRARRRPPLSVRPPGSGTPSGR